jgi:hypothetical protein
MVVFMYFALLCMGVIIAMRLSQDPSVLLRSTAIALLAACALIALLAASGWRMFSVRVRHQPDSPAVDAAVAEIHHSAGSRALPTIVFFTPVLVAAALAHEGTWRRTLHAAAALALVTIWLASDLTGHLLPHSLPNPIPRESASSVLRFVFLHMLVAPVLLLILILLMSWRHFRRAAAIGRDASLTCKP